MSARLSIIALPGLPMVARGDDLAGLILDGVARAGETLLDRDVIVVAQKIVSKAEGRIVDLRTVTPSERAVELARATLKDPRHIEVLLRESREVVRHRPGVVIAENRHGHVMANAGIDHSNVEQTGAPDEILLLLPEDPDASARALREEIGRRTGRDVGIVINDSFGRAWRVGTCGVAIGVAGLPAVRDIRGEPDLYGRALQVSIVGHADEIAAAASIVQGQADEGTPVALVRGLPDHGREGKATDLVRAKEQDLFR